MIQLFSAQKALLNLTETNTVLKKMNFVILETCATAQSQNLMLS